jgi:hypothetical protein
MGQLTVINGLQQGQRPGQGQAIAGAAMRPERKENGVFGV